MNNTSNNPFMDSRKNTLTEIGFPITAIHSLLKISTLNNTDYLVYKIEQELEHLIVTRQIRKSASVKQILSALHAG